MHSLKATLAAFLMLAATASAQNRIWSSPSYGKADPREWMPESIYTNCVLWLPMNTDPAQFGTWGVPDGSPRRYNMGQTNSSARPAYDGSGRGSLSFGGVDDFATTAGVVAELNSNNAFSVCAWVNTGVSTTTRNIFGSLSSYATVGLSDGFLFQLRSNNVARALFQEGVSGEGFYQQTSGTVVATGLWVHLSFVLSSLSSRTVVIYTNGAVAASEFTQINPGTLTLNSVRPLEIGRQVSSGGFLSYFSGFIDDALIFNRALTSNEVYTIYNRTKGTHP